MFGRSCFGLALLVAASGCMVNVNGKTKTYGLSDLIGSSSESSEDGKKEAKGEGDASGDEADDTPRSSDTKTVAVKASFHPNPIIVSGLAGEAAVNTDKHGVRNGCNGYVGDDPAVVLDMEQESGDIEVSAPGGGVLLAEIGGKYWCDSASSIGQVPRIKADKLPAGKIKIFVGELNKGTKIKFSVRVEDTKRAIDLAWKDKVKPVVLNEDLKQPIIVTQTTPTTKGVKDDRSFRCGKGFTRETPDFAFELKRPLTDLQLDFRSSHASQMDLVILGPIPEDGRNLPSRCIENVPQSFGRMEPGLYVARVSPEENGAAWLYHLVLTSKGTPREPKTLPTKFADNVPFEERVVTGHFPLLTVDDVHDSDATREWLFVNAPKQLFVYPKYDLDDKVARVYGAARRGGYTTSSFHPKAPAEVFPKANEPLLLLSRGQVLAADGSIFNVEMKDLTDKPSGALALPSASRNPHLTWDHALYAHAPEDDKLVAAYEKANKDLDACEDRVWNPAEKQIDAIRARPWWQQSEGQIQQIKDATSAAFDRTCKPDALKQKQLDTWAALMKSRSARRDAALGRVKARF